MADAINAKAPAQAEAPAAPIPTPAAGWPGKAAAPPAAAPPAEQSLDDLLAEFDKAAPAPAAPEVDEDPLADLPEGGQRLPAVDLPAPTQSQEMLALMNWAMRVDQGLRATQDHQDTLAAITSIRGDIPDSIYSDTMVAAWVKQQSQANPKLQTAWENRRGDPKTYDRAVTELGRKFAKEQGTALAGLPDLEATADREAVAAAVRGSGKPPPPENPAGYQRRVSNMTNEELRQHTKATYGYDPGV